MPMYEYVAEHCLESLYCPKRFAFRQSMHAPPVGACPRCGTELRRIQSSFSAGIDMSVNAKAWTTLNAGSDTAPATLKNIFGGGLGDLGCGYRKALGGGNR